MFKIISADGHVEVPPETWSCRVSQKWRSKMPRTVALEDGGSGLYFETMGSAIPLAAYLRCGRPAQEAGAPISYAMSLPGLGDAQTRLAELDRDNVWAEVLYPSASFQILQSHVSALPPQARIEMARAYNDWLSEEYTSVARSRLHGMAMLPNTSIEDNLSELERVADLAGICGVVLFEWPSGNGYPSDSDAAFWTRACEIGMPLSIHEAMGTMAAGEAERPHSKGHKLSLLARTGGRAGFTAIQVVVEGVFDRFPALRIHFAESGGGWLPFFAQQADDNYDRHRFRSGLELHRRPSDYLRENFLWGIQNDPLAVAGSDVVGPGNTCWGSDFPHTASDWPSSGVVLADMFAGRSDESAMRLVTNENVANFYSLAL